MVNNINILVLDRYEQVIKWLHPDKTEIVETNKQKTQRTIQITYPLEHDITGDESQWFEQGNKIFIPETLGIDSCLYVINTQYSIDYWEKNVVTVSAEEVLTELNYSMFEYTEKTALKINKENLEKWFGDFYQIDTIDTLNSSKNTINPFGTMTRMSLLRLIEETTEYIFKTSYTHKNVTITRHLSLLKPENMRNNDPKHPEYYYINLSRNMESLELDVDESSTYTAMAPVLSLQDGTTNTAGTVTTTATTTTSDVNNIGTSGTNADDIQKALKNWKALKVDYREFIPMIITQDSDGKITYGAKWYAPFIKEKDSLYIYTPAYSNTSYNEVIPMNSKPQNGVIYPLQKIGTVQTSEKDPYAIYNTLANSLLSKTKPKFTLKVSVKDVQTIVGGDNSLGYQLYDTLYVKVPGFDYYVKCTVTETKKNPHLPGENTITVTSEVSGTHLQENTIILANDIKVDKTNYVPLQGNLLTVDNVPVGNALMNMSITIEKTYTVTLPTNSPQVDPNTPQLQAVLDFKPETETYYFTNGEILNMAKLVKNYKIQHQGTKPNTVNMRATNGKIYRVPQDWYRAIYYARNQHYILTEGWDKKYLGTGNFPKSIPVHYFSNVKELINKYAKEGKTYDVLLVAWFHDRISNLRTYIYNKYYKQKDSSFHVDFDPVSSSEQQNNNDCALARFSNISEYFFNYKTESEMLDAFGFKAEVYRKKDTGGLPPQDDERIKRLGYGGFWVEATWDNMLKYTGHNYALAISVDCSNLPYYQKFHGYKANSRAYHAITVPSVFSVKNGGKYVFIEDSNFPVFLPGLLCEFTNYQKKTYCMDELTPDMFVSWNTLYNAFSCIEITSGSTAARRLGLKKGLKMLTDPNMRKILRSNGISYRFVMYVVQLQTSQRSLDAVPRTVPSDSKWNPWGVTYYISSTEIQRAYKQLLKDWWINYSTKSFLDLGTTIKDVNGNKYNVSGKWILSMLRAYTNIYSTDYSHDKKEQVIQVGVGTDAIWYYNIFTSNWTTLSHVTNTMYNIINPSVSLISVCIVQYLSYRMGNFVTIHTITEIIKKIIKNGVWDITDCLAKLPDNLHYYYFSVECTIDNMRKYMRAKGIYVSTFIIPRDGSVLKRVYDEVVASVTNYTHYVSGSEFGVYLGYLINNDVCVIFTGIGAGNSPNFYPNTPSSSSPNCNPWRSVSMSEIKDANHNLPKNNYYYNKLIIYSPWDKKTTKEIVNGKIPSKPWDYNKGKVTE